MEPAELYDISVDREVFLDPPRAAAPRLSRKEKRARKWTSMYAHIFARRAYTEPFYLWNYL